MGLFFYVIFVSNLMTMPLYLLMWLWLYSGGAARMSKSQSTALDAKQIQIKWNDVIGMEEAKEEAVEVVSLIKDHILLKKIGGQILRGILMIGPPGCGKTYLAKAIAAECKLPFISVAGSEFIEMFVGVGAARVRKLFKKARNIAEVEGGCIIFIDEIDAVAARRSLDVGSGGQREANTTVNQLLVEMDGLKEKDMNIVVIGATNAPEDFLDSAILRPGRFDRKIFVHYPTFEERKKLLEYYLSKVKYNSQEISTEKFAGILDWWSPAEVANLVRESALLAVRNKKEAIGLKEVEEARERIELGFKRSSLRYSEEELKATAYHEAGHCVAQYFFSKDKKVPFKLSIIPRTRTLGVAWSGAERGDKGQRDRNELLSIIRNSLAGYAAEKIKLGVTTAGVSSDFNNAMSVAHKMVWRLGMGKSGYIGDFYALAIKDNPYQQGDLLLSQELRANLDKETQEILQECLRDVEQLLERESELMEGLVEELMNKRELNYEEIEAVFKRFAKTDTNS